MTQPQQPKKTIGSYTNDNVLESIRGIGSSVGQTVTKDVIGQIGADMLTSVFSPVQQSGELKQNQAVEFGKPQENKETPRVQPQELSRPRVYTEGDEIKRKIEAVRKELQALAQSVKKLNQEVHNTIMETPVNPGVYHLNFFDQLRTYLITLKESVDDSRSWLSAFNTKKKKQGYWAQYKKGGTSFGLSNERTLATQAG